MNGLKARKDIVKAEDAEKYFQQNGVVSTELNGLLKAIEDLPLDHLDAGKKARFITYFKGFGAGAPLDDIKATLVSFHFVGRLQ